MSDNFAVIRGVPLMLVMAALGIDVSQFTKRGNKEEYYGACIFCQPKHNKTAFSFTSELYHCFSCGIKGRGAIDFVKEFKKIGFQEAVQLLQGLQLSNCPEIPASSPPKENQPFKASYEKFYQENTWLKTRIPDSQVLSTFGVGFYHNPSRKSSYDGKVMFVLRRFSDGEKIGYLARTIEPKESEPKYLFPKGFQKHLELYGAWELKQRGQALPLRVVYLVESPLCVLKYASLGIPAVSPFGWSVSPEQVELLSHLAKGVIYLPDRDKYSDISKPVHLLASSLWTRCPQLPEGVNDPEYLSLEQIHAL